MLKNVIINTVLDDDVLVHTLTGFTYVGSGTITVSGTSIPSTNYVYVGSGGIFVGGIGSVPANSFIIVDQWFQWNVIALTTVEQEFEWNFGPSILYWWEVNSACLPSNCNQFIIQDNNNTCPGTMFTKLILAPNITDVCNQLTALGINSRIVSISQFSKAAYTADQLTLTAQGVDQTCNQKTSVPFCQIPECLDFCVDYDISMNFGFTFVENEQYDQAGGTITIGGSAICFIVGGPSSGYIGTGTITIGGSALVISSSYQFPGGSGLGIAITGTALVTSSQWNYVGSGRIQISSNDVVNYDGNGNIISGNYNFIGGVSSSFNVSSSDCFPDNLMTIEMTDKFGTFIMSRDGDNFILCRQLILSSDDSSNSPVSAPMQYTFSCGNNPSGSGIVWTMLMNYPTISPYMAGAASGYNCGNLSNAPYQSGSNPSNQGHYLVGGIASFPIDTTFYFPCFDCFGYYGWASENYYQAYSIGYSDDPQDVGIKVSSGTLANYPIGISIGGSAIVSMSFTFNSTGQGSNFTSMKISGTAIASQSYPRWYYTGSGGIHITGNPIVNIYNYQGSGDIHIGGNAIVYPGQYYWTNTGYHDITISGSSICSYNDFFMLMALGSETDVYENIGMDIDISDFQVQLNEQNLDESIDPNLPVITIPVDVVATACDCNAVNQIIYLQNNFASCGELQNFLNRNNLNLASVLNMSYNIVYKQWQTNIHYSGISADGTTKENWNIVFSWQCNSILGGVDQGLPLWNFGAYFNQNLGSENFVTRLLFTFSQLGPCQESSSITFVINANTTNQTVTSDPKHSPYNSVFQDSIGMFNSPSWLANPNLNIIITETVRTSTTNRLNYNYNLSILET